MKFLINKETKELYLYIDVAKLKSGQTCVILQSISEKSEQGLLVRSEQFINEECLQISDNDLSNLSNSIIKT